MWRRIGILLLLAAAVLAWRYALRPVCVPLTAAEVARFDPPIDQRTDRDMGLQVFQRREGTWYQCKTALSRALFF